MANAAQIDPESELIRSFPESVGKIRELIARDQDFREIADDWFFCKWVLRNLMDSPEIHKQLIREYTEAMLALEEELKMLLAASMLGDFTHAP